MYSRKSRELALLSLIVAITLAACRAQATPIPALRDDSLLTGEPCAPPCWQGLTPGQTSSEEVQRFLIDDPLVNGNIGERLYVPNAKGFSEHWWWAGEPQESWRLNSIEIDKQNIVELISITPNTDLAIGDIIHVYGAPTLISASVVYPFDAFDSTPEGIAFSALYVDRRFQIDWFEEVDIDQKPLRLCPSLRIPIHHIAYYNTVKVEIYERELRQTSSSSGWLVMEGKSIVAIVGDRASVNCIEMP